MDQKVDQEKSWLFCVHIVSLSERGLSFCSTSALMGSWFSTVIFWNVSPFLGNLYFEYSPLFLILTDFFTFVQHCSSVLTKPALLAFFWMEKLKKKTTHLWASILGLKYNGKRRRVPGACCVYDAQLKQITTRIFSEMKSDSDHLCFPSEWSESCWECAQKILRHRSEFALIAWKSAFFQVWKKAL